MVGGYINPLDFSTVFSGASAYFKFAMANMMLRFTQPHFIKRTQVINKKVIGGELVIIEIQVKIRIKETVANSIK